VTWNRSWRRCWRQMNSRWTELQSSPTPCTGDSPARLLIMINIKNCSLSIVLTATDQKLLKRWYYPQSHHPNVMWCWVILLFNDLCCFWSVAVNTVDKLQFLILTFAVLLRNLCSVSLCNCRQFWNNVFDFQDCGCTPYSIFQKLKTLRLR